jgi:prevent-host-death family protein
MAEQVNIHAAKTHLSRLIERVEAGEEIVIARAGRPVARLVPLGPNMALREPGRWIGRVALAPDFDASDPELLDAFDSGEQPQALIDAATIPEIVRESHIARDAQIAEAVAPYLTSKDRLAPGSEVDRLPAIVGRIVRLVDPARIILFGSRARGDAHKDSDYDILVVMEHVNDARATRIALRKALDDLPISKDIVVAALDRVDGRLGPPWGVLHWALREGRTLYERA